jgi:hypothetical protein
MHDHGFRHTAPTFDQGGLAVGVALVTLMILLAAVVAAMFDRQSVADPAWV